MAKPDDELNERLKNLILIKVPVTDDELTEISPVLVVIIIVIILGGIIWWALS